MDLMSIARQRPIRIVADSSIPYLREGMPCEVETDYLPTTQITSESIREADVLMIRSVTHCDAALLEGSRVQLVTSATAGYDHIDVDYCRQKGVLWYNAPGCNASSVVQYVMSVIGRYALREGMTSQDMVLGIVGTGHTGGRIFERSEALGLRVLLCDPPLVRAYDEHPDWEGYLRELDAEGLPRPYLADQMPQLRARYCSMEELMAQATLITLHVPLTHGGEYPTYHLVDASWLSSLRQKPYLINACRGAVVDTQALIEALRAGALSGVAIDCWEQEPIISRELLSLADVATPHIAGFSLQGKVQGTMMSLTQLCRHCGISQANLRLIHLPTVSQPLIDLSGVSGWEVPWRAILETLPLASVHSRLLESPDTFEQQRVSYKYPYEPSSYIVVRREEDSRVALAALGFRCVDCS